MAKIAHNSLFSKGKMNENLPKRVRELMENKRWKAVCEELPIGETTLQFRTVSELDTFIATMYQMNSRGYQSHFKSKSNFKDLTLQVFVSDNE